MYENEKFIKFMTKNNLTVDDVARICERKRKTVFSWRSDRIPPHWVIPYLKTKLQNKPKLIQK